MQGYWSFVPGPNQIGTLNMYMNANPNPAGSKINSCIAILSVGDLCEIDAIGEKEITVVVRAGYSSKELSKVINI